MTTLQVIEKITAGGASELVWKGYSDKLLNRYLSREVYATPNAIFVKREARPDDCLVDVPGVTVQKTYTL